MKDVVKKDLVIIGGGPAGLTASLYASRSLLDAITLEQEAVGGQVILTSEVDNYPAVPHVDGYTLVEAMLSAPLRSGGAWRYRHPARRTGRHILPNDTP